MIKISDIKRAKENRVAYFFYYTVPIPAVCPLGRCETGDRTHVPGAARSLSGASHPSPAQSSELLISHPSSTSLLIFALRRDRD
jgi:hypothetical protein